MSQAPDAYQLLEGFAGQAPEIADAIRLAMDKWTRGPKPLSVRSQLEQMRDEVLPMLETYVSAAESMRQAAIMASLDHEATVRENAQLQQRVAALEGSLQWRRDHVSDQGSQCPALFSNVRHAFRMLFSSR